jgi:hypothetical protein
MDVAPTTSHPVDPKFTTCRGDLETTVLPLEYRITLEPDPKYKLVYGKCIITLKITEPCTYIRLHALNMKIHRGKIKAQVLFKNKFRN